MQQSNKFLVIHIALKTLEIFNVIKDGDKISIDFKIVFTVDKNSLSAQFVREALKTVSMRTGESYLDKNSFIDEKKNVITVVAYGDFAKVSLVASTLFSLNSVKKIALDMGLTLSSEYTSEEVFSDLVRKNNDDDFVIVAGGFENTNSSHIVAVSDRFSECYFSSENKSLNPLVLYVGNAGNTANIKNIFSSKKAEIIFEENTLSSLKETNSVGCVRGVNSIIYSILLGKISDGQTLWKEKLPFISDVSAITSFIEGFFYEKKIRHLKVIKLDKEGAYLSSFYKPENEKIRKYTLFARYSDMIFTSSNKIKKDAAVIMKRYFSSSLSDEELAETALRIMRSGFYAYTSADKSESFSLLKVFITKVVFEHTKYVNSIRDTEQPRLPETAFQVRGTKKSPTSKDVDMIILTGMHHLLAEGSERQIMLSLIDGFYPSGFTRILWDKDSVLNGISPVFLKTKALNYSETGDTLFSNLGYVFAPVSGNSKESIFNIRIRNDEYAHLISLKRNEIDIYNSEKSFFMKPEWNNEIRLDPSFCGLVMDMRCREVT